MRRIQVQVRVPASVPLEQVHDILFSKSSGLSRDESSSPPAQEPLRSEVGTYLQVGAFVVSAVTAAKSLYELIQLIKKSRTTEKVSMNPKVEIIYQPIFTLEKHSHVSIIVNEAIYDLDNSTDETISPLLEK